MYYKVASVDAIVLYFEELISEEVSGRVLSLYHHLKQMAPKGILELIPSYTTLYVQFDLFAYTHETLYEKLSTLAKQSDSMTEESGKVVTIPAYFDSSVGWDLEKVAKRANLSTDEVIAIYTAQIYRVYTIGFLPGYAYMGSVDARIATPRLATPRSVIPKGSVAIANTQCAVYPQESPGGWNIIGRTYLEMFDKDIEGFSLLKAGDRVRFEAISKERFVAAGGAL